MLMRPLIALFLMTLFPLAQAAEPELMATLSVMGYGYKVKVMVNGADIGIEGGKSEGRRLFNMSHAMAAKATPAIRQKNFVLVPGANEFVLEYAKIDPKSSDQLEVTLEAEGYPQPLLHLKNIKKTSDKTVARVHLAEKAPPDFKPLVIHDGK
jgi:hypothetical protein